MSNCLVIGGKGFIGSHLAEALIVSGETVYIFTGDFLIESDLIDAMEDIEYVFHYASTTNPVSASKDPFYDLTTNVAGTIRLLQVASEWGVKKVIFASSGGLIYGEPEQLPIPETAPTNPTNPYAISKLAIEKYLAHFYKDYGLDYVSLRYSNPYGERQQHSKGQGAIPIFLNNINEGKISTVFGDGSAIRDYIYIKDAVDATLAVYKKNIGDKIFNIGSGTGSSITDIITTAERVTQKSLRREYIKTSGVRNNVLDISRIKGVTGWAPTTSLDEGIKRTWEWMNSL